MKKCNQNERSASHRTQRKTLTIDVSLKRLPQMCFKTDFKYLWPRNANGLSWRTGSRAPAISSTTSWMSLAKGSSDRSSKGIFIQRPSSWNFTFVAEIKPQTAHVTSSNTTRSLPFYVDLGNNSGKASGSPCRWYLPSGDLWKGVGVTSGCDSDWKGALSA